MLFVNNFIKPQHKGGRAISIPCRSFMLRSVRTRGRPRYRFEDSPVMITTPLRESCLPGFKATCQTTGFICPAGAVDSQEQHAGGPIQLRDSRL